MARRKLIHGWGVNDADYVTKKVVDGKEVSCPYYMTWRGMVTRCFSDAFKIKNPTYTNCTVQGSWKYFSNFKAWMEKQDWEGNELDKDLLLDGNKHYSEETCLFVSHNVNSFLLDGKMSRGRYPIGVSWHEGAGKFLAQVRSSNKNIYLGLFDCVDDASEAYTSAKREIAMGLADSQSDSRIRDALIKRYSGE